MNGKDHIDLLERFLVDPEEPGRGRDPDRGRAMTGFQGRQNLVIRPPTPVLAIQPNGPRNDPERDTFDHLGPNINRLVYHKPHTHIFPILGRPLPQCNPTRWQRSLPPTHKALHNPKQCESRYHSVGCVPAVLIRSPLQAPFGFH